MEIRELCSLFLTGARREALESLLKDKKVRGMVLSGLPASAPALLLASVKPFKGPALVVADDPESAGYLYNDLVQILGQEAVQILPSGYKRDIKYGQPDPPAQILRTEAIAACGVKGTRYIVSCPEGLAEMVPSPGQLEAASVTFTKGATMLMSEATDKLLALGFNKVDYVYEPGQFARRGSILDIFSYSHELPYRVDFFDDEIDSVRTFDVETQLSREQVNSIAVVGALEKGGAEGKASILAYLDKNVPVFCSSRQFLLERMHAIAEGGISQAVLESGEGDAEAMEAVIDPDKFEAELDERCMVLFGVNPSAPESAPRLDFGCSPQALYHKNFDLISESFKRLIGEGYKLYILSDSPAQCDRLKAIFSERGDDIPFTPVLRTLHEGFTDPQAKACFFTDHQIFDRFHKYNLRSERARGGKLAMSLKELGQIEVGDYIVHIDHGVGRFGGLVKTDVAGKPQEMIKLIYAGDDIIFCSIHALHKLSKYRGKEGIPPKINKLGTGAWNKIKERTKSKMKDIARDLIRLYAARRDQKGFAYSPDSYLQHELEASFIYEDTPDQLTATAAVKADMESSRPMDRLICGDVGFGKTEIAIRAAFKAAVDGKQTAVLVPTTVLAMQHYHTFSDRLRDLPVRVDYISRARKPKEVKQILADLEVGKIDILIGTHKIIGKGVKFKDLGLLVVDEEQKFGVAVKEKLKQMKVNVDTLTMSATPIPRTLQFSLMGARDLSNLNTPPANRQPILTTVSVMDDDLVKEAVSFEISRGGQVFFICNRIEQLATMENMLRRLVPGVRVVTAHGQMPPEKLEKAIVDFASGDYDVLLSTTIVESGIDMPGVNTIIISDAQNFGLSELHQLRGRVGRSSRKAFAYLLTPPGKELTTVARRRLQAIESFSDLGSGIHIAMQDLDIRGAGNLLGAEQSGFIADLGYETYQKILKESVMELKTEEFGDTFTDENAGKEEEFVADCAVESDLELRLPPEYVPQEGERIALYQELDNMEGQESVNAFRERLIDRFGPLPAVSEELIRIVPLRTVAKQLGIERLLLKQGKMYLYFTGDENKAYYQSPAFGRVLAYMQLHTRRCTLREKAGKRSMVISGVPDVLTALDTITAVRALQPV
ncbi:MAG: transcription-repair coupling factor [Prevotella sp.]|nr:transcription-repair coupling factor [Prevotella sp.]MCM1074886.1 transcription-repair coupling factor [Ruminococcus sp.]